jgi:hypothetical protein
MPHAAPNSQEQLDIAQLLTFYNVFLPYFSGRREPVWAVLTLAAAAGLLAGYTLGVAQQFSHKSRTILASFDVVRSAGNNNYTVLSGAAWSRSPWSQPCSSVLPRPVAAGVKEPRARKQLPVCELPSIWRNCSQGI